MFIAFTTRNTQNATIRKLITTVMKLPYPAPRRSPRLGQRKTRCDVKHVQHRGVGGLSRGEFRVGTGHVGRQGNIKIAEVRVAEKARDDGHDDVVDERLGHAANAAPMITPTARSMTFPFKANSRNSEMMPIACTSKAPDASVEAVALRQNFDGFRDRAILHNS